MFWKLTEWHWALGQTIKEEYKSLTTLQKFSMVLIYVLLQPLTFLIIKLRSRSV